ncbi:MULTISPECIES: iron-sulfur cluster assembly scaffold protein [unclassified Campylobacter]|uniref:iron-sulfur cluster assembly scaffold protein n=1 Tax=unclassified Campylobacter TaxID=2593542 RepID=UPI001237D74C|nr:MULTISPECIES: iron-sulfur cluster assembly scaffold protein [unclassified Campylobacter]KAA6225458.1 iron-sulfur cluster assembly scaffold protein NifU [Campylobacter sp. LR196d]KAA6228810.1 iron-sulfur cluster assembly scaffold protein NifU [Campylobacter sp. LR185c]KAA6229947.1 iron-sulfur cluster assembly scaffold protein NifU [Campylobacter sp. LR286c]KAA6234254.1 iron-sulfur cluster assembly scaffold protein NifU [Campylobacter sp. LR291e]KAA8604136.1 iron-sulfur cluster assembly scaff
MAKNNLIGGSIWDEYSQKVQNRMNNPLHMGEFNEEDAKKANAKLIVADFGAESCGDAVRLFWLVDEKTDTIIDAKFKSFGCGTAIASSDTMVDLCIGKTVDEAVKITNLDVEFAMRDDPNTPAVPPQKMHCSVMAYDVIKQAAAHYKGISPEDFEDQIIVCECARVSLGTIKEVIKLNDLKSVEEITQYTKAGAFCKSCVRPGGHEKRDYYLVDILAQTRAEMDKERVEKAINSDTIFDDMTLVGQLKAVENILDTEVRPMLQNDGGDMEVIDIQKATDKTIDVYIRYLGACSGCSSGSGATLYAIETILQEELSPNIRVMPV